MIAKPKANKQCEEDTCRENVFKYNPARSEQHFVGIKKPNEQQTIAWKSLLLEGRDRLTLATLPTGHHGKFNMSSSHDIAKELSIRSRS